MEDHPFYISVYKKDKPHNPIRIRFLKNITAYMQKKHRKKIPQMFAGLKKVRTFATANEKQHRQNLKT